MLIGLVAGAGAISSCFATAAFAEAARRNLAIARLNISARPAPRADAAPRDCSAAREPTVEELISRADARYLRKMYGVIAFQLAAIGATGLYLRRDSSDGVALAFGALWGAILFGDSFSRSTFIDTLAK